MKFTTKGSFLLIDTKEIKAKDNVFHLYTLVDTDTYDKIQMLGSSDFNFEPKTPVIVDFTLKPKDKGFTAFVVNVEEVQK